ncbi:hypothetical protein [Parvibaculum lavamentivorans]|nr:hypothetical protein [Parvibaculum lavamentivorans]
MTTAQHLASHVAAQTRSASVGLSAQVERLWTAIAAQIHKTRTEFSPSDAFTAAGYSLLGLYATGFVAYIAVLY